MKSQLLKQFIPKESCLGCHGCCRFSQQNSVWSPCLLDEEIQGLLDKDVPKASICVDRRLCLIPHPDQEGYICPFLDVLENKCKIYASRPLECQLYPFLITLRDKKIILTVDLNCPYINKNLDSKELKEYTEYLISFLNEPPQINALKDNPHILQAYEDVLDMVELRPTDEAK